MCGLVAIINVDGVAPGPDILSTMADRIAHRGPDAEGSWQEGGIGFYHKRLSIIDILSGGQPMTRDNTTLVYNGEIYNYVELRAELERLGEHFTTESDTEVLLRAYLYFGPGFVRRLRGMFAFVVYDARNNSVMAARDHFGIKPLYRCETKNAVLYASEIKALLAHPDVGAEVDQEAVTEYLTFQHTLGTRTLFRGITKIEPATYEILVPARPHRSNCVRYWQPDYSIDRSMTEPDAVENLRELLTRSVSRQLRSDVPLGGHLSGGLDSSTVVSLAAREYGSGFQTFTGAFREGLEFDESRFAAEVAERVGALQHLVHITESDFVDNLDRLSYAMDEPAAGPGLLPQYIVSRLAARNVKVCLGGQGGDELFGGYTRYTIAILEAALRDAIDNPLGANVADVGLDRLASQLPLLKQYKPMITRFFSKGMFESPERRYFALLDRSGGVKDLLAEDVRTAYRQESIFSKFSKIFQESGARSYLNQMLYFDMRASLPALLHVEDRVSMAVSLESRVPLLDPDIADFAARVPVSIKYKDGESKYLLKRAAAPWIPASILKRKDKMGFPVPLHLWRDGPAREFVCDTLLGKRCKERGIFNVAALERLLAGDDVFGRGLWGVLQLELWHRNFIDTDYNSLASGGRHAAVVH